MTFFGEKRVGLAFGEPSPIRYSNIGQQLPRPVQFSLLFIIKGASRQPIIACNRCTVDVVISEGSVAGRPKHRLQQRAPSTTRA